MARKKERNKPNEVNHQGVKKFKVEYTCVCCGYEGIRYAAAEKKYVYCHECERTQLVIENIGGKLVAFNAYLTADDLAMFNL